MHEKHHPFSLKQLCSNCPRLRLAHGGSHRQGAQALHNAPRSDHDADLSDGAKGLHWQFHVPPVWTSRFETPHFPTMFFASTPPTTVSGYSLNAKSVVRASSYPLLLLPIENAILALDRLSSDEKVAMAIWIADVAMRTVFLYHDCACRMHYVKLEGDVSSAV